MTPRRERALAALVCALVAAILWLVPLPSAPGLTWDEAYYYPAFRDVAAWFGTLADSPATALSAAGIEAGWSRINELPPVVKLLGALSLAPSSGGAADLHWMRLVPALAFGATLMLLFSVARRFAPARIAAIAPAAYALHPHLYGHAQIAATETVFCLLAVASIAIALGGTGRWSRRLALAIVAGLALATKVNGLILLVALAAFLLLRRTMARGRPNAPSRSDLFSLGAIVALSPLVALAVWPWMWHETGARLAGYYNFVAAHSHQPTWFLGERTNIDLPSGYRRAPLHYPLVMLLATAPLAWLALVGVGAAALIVRIVRTRRLRPAVLLLALAAIGPFAASSLPSSPKYDSIRLFLPMFAPLVLLTVAGVASVPWLRRRGPGPTIAAVALLALSWAVAVRERPLSFYNAVAVRAATADTGIFGFERTFWGDALDQAVLRDLNTTLPPNARVKTLALQTEAFPILQQWGMLRADITFPDTPPFDAHLMQNRKGFWGRAEWALAAQRTPLRAWHPMPPNDDPLVFLFDGRPPGAD